MTEGILIDLFVCLLDVFNSPSTARGIFICQFKLVVLTFFPARKPKQGHSLQPENGPLIFLASVAMDCIYEF